MQGTLFVTALLLLGAGPPPARPLTLTFAGDVTLGYHFEEYFDEQVKKGTPSEQMLGYGFKQVRAAAKAGDLFVVNLECPLTSRGEKIPKNFNFRSRPELVGVLARGGVDVVSLANNHLMDYGAVGLADTLQALDEAKIVHFGAGANLAEARRPAIVERNGRKIAFLGYFFLGDRNIEPPEVLATETTPGVAGTHADDGVIDRWLAEDIALAKKQADLVIPFFHWGREGSHLPEEYQTRLAHLAIDAGAAAVVGAHPHVLQGMELYKGAPVLYSLGNFVFGGNWDPKDKETALVELRFGSKGFTSAKLLPARSDRYPEFPMQPVPVKGEEADSVLKSLGDYSKGFPRTLPELAPAK
ncbi:MAG: CapA family protein [Myxococcaceae bacterium]